MSWLSLVPLIVVPPRSSQKKLAASGQRCDRPVNLIDLYPTLIQFCGLENPPHKLDGQSLVPLLEKPDSTAERSSITMFGPGNASLRTDRWRFIRYADGSEELYDLTQDPREWVNLAGNSVHVERLAVLRSKIAPFLLVPEKR